MVQFHERIFFLWPPSQKLARLWHCTAMQILGVTGGIGSGKSTFCSVFKELGIPVIDADILSREALQPGNPCYYKVIRTFGPFLGASLYLGTETALTEGVPMENSPLLDRVKLGELVFKNTELKKALESIVHPFVRRQIILQLLKYFICGYSLVILEVPLLFETGLHRYCSKTLLVCWYI